MATSIEDCKKIITDYVSQYHFSVVSTDDIIEHCWRACWPIIEQNADNLDWEASADPNYLQIITEITADFIQQQQAFDQRDRYAFRKNYPEFIFESYDVIRSPDGYHVTYHYRLGEHEFHPQVFIDTADTKNTDRATLNQDFLDYLFFNFGIINAINYYKLSFAPRFTIKAGKLTPEQCDFFKKLFYYGLEECMYRNELQFNYDEFMTIDCEAPDSPHHFELNQKFEGNLIPVGGGKDSVVTLEALSPMRDQNLCLQYNRDIYPVNQAALDCIKLAGYGFDKIVNFDLTLDPHMLELNREGFYNGHIPFSSCLAFASVIMAYLNHKAYIVLSNEASANEGNIAGTTINHQYSKSFEFERDFENYIQSFLTTKIHYFSLLRCWNEYQIIQRFVQYPLYLDVFRSCNVGTKQNAWCGHCAKCLYVYIMLYPFVSDQKLWQIFGGNLLDNTALLDIFIGLVRPDATKPFECVGTREEIAFSIEKGLALKPDQRPALYHYYLENLRQDTSAYQVEKYFNSEHQIPENYLAMLQTPVDHSQTNSESAS